VERIVLDVGNVGPIVDTSDPGTDESHALPQSTLQSKRYLMFIGPCIIVIVEE